VSEREAEVLAEIRRLAATDLRIGFPVEPSHHLVHDLKLDSVGALTLAVALEDRFRVVLSDADAAAVATVGDLVQLVARRADADADAP
jgi:acyl carrier protein